MTYISYIIYYFEDKPASHEYNRTFELQFDEIKNYSKYHKVFLELQSAGLVVINKNDTISFLNLWDKHIDKTLLTRRDPDEFLLTATPKKITEYRDELMTRKTTRELLYMRYGLNEQEMDRTIKDFIAEQENAEKTYYSIGECATHCVHWAAKRLKDKPRQKPAGKILGRLPDKILNN